MLSTKSCRRAFVRWKFYWLRSVRSTFRWLTCATERLCVWNIFLVNRKHVAKFGVHVTVAVVVLSKTISVDDAEVGVCFRSLKAETGTGRSIEWPLLNNETINFCRWRFLNCFKKFISSDACVCVCDWVASFNFFDFKSILIYFLLLVVLQIAFGTFR